MLGRRAEAHDAVVEVIGDVQVALAVGRDVIGEVELAREVAGAGPERAR